ncbi:MAG: cation acetate symporter [Desulfobacteraceae bacterium]
MIYVASPLAIGIFVAFVLGVLGMSSFFARKTQSASGYYAAGGSIHWAVNGVAFAGDYLSAASFLGICGMIAFDGYDGFLYSIGYLAGWVVALFLVAEPMKRFGKYTFTDALNYKFNSKGIELASAISTLIVSLCYLIPQMVGAGDLVTPLLGLQHHWGVIIVGIIVIYIVATAGMTSTTYVQFIKGGLLVVFSTILAIAIFMNGINKTPYEGYHEFKALTATVTDGNVSAVDDPAYTVAGVLADPKKPEKKFVKLQKEGINTWWSISEKDGTTVLKEALSVTKTADKKELYNGAPKADKRFFQVGHAAKVVMDGQEVEKTGPISPFKFLSTVQQSEVVRFSKTLLEDGTDKVIVYAQNPTAGSDIMRPGLKFKVDKGSTFMSKLNFVSLMLALFFGTAALPHILIRYYTVPSPKDARKSTIVAIGSIGFFYILTVFMGLGAMLTGVIDLNSSNMSAPLLAKFFGIFIFSCISAIAFSTVLGTVSGLIVAASGAVAHDLLTNYMGLKMTDKGQVTAGKIAAVCIGILAMILGIIFKGINVSFLVGLAFAVASAANLPSILMMLFWKKTTAQGIICSIFVGIVTSLVIILLSPATYVDLYKTTAIAPIPLDNPGIVAIPLSFLTLVVVSLLTQKEKA